MNLASPIQILAAWVIYPCVVLLISLGAGLLLERASGKRLGVLALPYGFVAVLVAYTFFLLIGLPADVVSVLVALAALGGILLRALRPRAGERAFSAFVRKPSSPAIWSCVAAFAVFAIAMLPLVVTGRLGVLGYYFLNDPAWHTGLIEWLHANGAQPAPAKASGWDMISMQLKQGYPLGTYAWPLIGITFTGSAGLAIWTPSCALALSMIAILVHRFVRASGANARWATALAVVVSSSYLLTSYFAQGGLKELLFTLVLLCSAYAVTTIKLDADSRLLTQWRSTLPAAISFAALAVVFGPGAGVWGGQMIALVVIGALIWPGGLSRGRIILLTIVWGLTALVLALPAVIAAFKQISVVSNVADVSRGIGNLLGPVPLREVFGAWISPDYRLPEPTAGFEDWSYVLSAVAGLLAVIGGVRELRERRWFVPLGAFAGLTAIIYIERHYNLYFAAKSYVPFAPIVGCAVASGIIWLVRSDLRRRKVVGIALAAAFVFSWAVGYSNIYSHTFMTPTERLQELAQVNEKISGDGPSILSEREEYGAYMLRAGRTYQPWSMFGPAIGTVVAPGGQFPPDVDAYVPAEARRFNTFVSRRAPTASRPPSNFQLIATTDHYVVWHRTGPRPLLHVPVGLGERGGAAPLDCTKPAVRTAINLAERRGKKLTIAPAITGVEYVPVAAIKRDAEWSPSAIDPEGFVGRAGPMGGSFQASLKPGVRYEAWVQGSFGPGIALASPKGEIGRVSRDLGTREQWTSLGTITGDGAQTLHVKPATTSELSPGSKLQDQFSAFAFAPVGATEKLATVTPAEARDYCGKPVDWIEVQN